MSFEAAAWAIKRRTRTPTAKLVLIALADCHNGDTGQCDPGNTYLADVAQCTKRSVINAIEELEALGYICTEKSNGRKTNYDLLLHVKQCNEFTGEKNAPVKTKHKPVKSEHPTGENDNTSFSIQPVRTSSKPVETPSGSNEAKSKRGTRLPGDWTLTEEFHTEAQRIRPDLINRIHEIADEFRDYWVALSGQRGVKVDWLATWRNWLRRERSSAPKFKTAADQRSERAAATYDYERATNF
ncbi:helix-turn-helix domain-containing protein [Microbulbifer sp. TRSA001]|uniref:helix-turn-helix domain-containing protein n=1 Tax=Microbulbifer sp. TRSA001 TaxID=3243381 RepID=UPI0040390818